MYKIFRIDLKLAAIALTAVILAFAAPYVLYGRAGETNTAAAPPASKKICLTFDDGPSKNTEALLDVLKKHDVRATFFVTAQNPDYLPLLEREHKEGHLVAAHTNTHDFSNIYASSENFWTDIGKINDEIERYTGERSAYLRFAGGSSNTVYRRFGPSGLMRTLAQECGQKGIVYVDWNVDTRDSVGSLVSASTIASRAQSGIRSQSLPVVLMHDGTANRTIAEAIDELLSSLSSEEYEFITVAELEREIHQTLS